MLSQQQQALVQAIQQLDLDQVQSLLADGLTRTLLIQKHGFPVSILCDGLFVWWENVCEAARLANRLLRQRNNSS